MQRIYLSPPDMGPAEREALLRAFDSGWVAPAGPEIDAFEREMEAFLSGDPRTSQADGKVYCAALSSGTAALHLALILLGVGPGDRVVVSSFTFAASANVVRYCGAEPVFVDSEPWSWNLDPDLLEQALKQLDAEGTPAKAVICTDLYGQCADYERIGPLCRRFRVPLVQDSAEAVGARFGRASGEQMAELPPNGDPVGLQGDLAIFSFNGNKILSTGGGGMLVSRDPGEIRKARFLATQAKEPFLHYEHRETGYNYRMNSLAAALGRAQLDRLPGMIERRKRIFEFYRDEMGDRTEIRWIPFGANGEPNYWLSCLVLEPEAGGSGLDPLIRAFDAADIEVRPLWKPMHLQPVFKNCRSIGGAFSEGLFRNGLCLPSGSGMNSEDCRRVIDCLKDALGG